MRWVWLGILLLLLYLVLPSKQSEYYKLLYPASCKFLGRSLGASLAQYGILKTLYNLYPTLYRLYNSRVN